MKEFFGIIASIQQSRWIIGKIIVHNGRIESIVEDHSVIPTHFILPGFIDSHVHIESSMLLPSQFAKAAVSHGTIATVSDPHEIANVLGADGVKFMIENGKTTPFNFFFGAPSCVPATAFETSGATLDASEVELLMAEPDIWYLGEMMNFPGVVYDDAEVHAKINAAQKFNKPVDGHAPLLTGEELKKYANAGISTDHECTNLEEAKAKINLGMKIIIREGSAACDFEALWPLIDLYPDHVMLCSDDLHPDHLVDGHINRLISRALAKGCSFFNTLKAAVINPINHYKLPLGSLNVGDSADFIIVSDLKKMCIDATYISGNCVYENGRVNFEAINPKPINRFVTNKISPEMLRVAVGGEKVKVIKVVDGELLTQCEWHDVHDSNNCVIANPEEDVLKIVVLNRYAKAKPQVAFIKGFGLKRGAIASSVAHDSHNLVAIGIEDTEIVKVLSLLQESKGGLAAMDGAKEEHLPLPYGGLMSAFEAKEAAEKYKKLNEMAKSMGSNLKSPFMTMAFMSLLVIPELKIGDRGLFDGKRFEFTSLFER